MSCSYGRDEDGTYIYGESFEDLRSGVGVGVDGAEIVELDTQFQSFIAHKVANLAESGRGVVVGIGVVLCIGRSRGRGERTMLIVFGFDIAGIAAGVLPVVRRARGLHLRMPTGGGGEGGFPRKWSLNKMQT